MKMKRIYFLLVIFASSFIASSQVTKTATSFAQSGTNSWTTSSTFNTVIQASDNIYLQSSVPTNGSSGILRLSGFGFTIPATATVNGIVVTIERHAATQGRITDQNIRLLLDGTEAGSNKALSQSWTASDTIVKYGGSTDKWGNTALTPANINTSGFGLAIQLQNRAAAVQTFIDMVSVTVYYTNTTAFVRFVSLEAKKQTSGVLLTWKVHEEDRLVSYDVERSADNVKFEKIGQVAATGAGEYTYTDLRPLSGKTYYRIRSFDMDTKYGYSTVICVYGSETAVVLKAFPSIVHSQLTIQHSAAVEGTTITITNLSGKQIQTLFPVKGSRETIADLSSLHSGLYFVHFINEKGAIESLKIVKH